MNIGTFYYYLGIISPIFSALAFIVGLLCIRSIRGYLVPVFLIVSVSFVIDTLSFICVRYNINIYFIYHLFTVIEFIMLSTFYHLFFRKYFKSGYFLFPIPVFLIVAFIDYKINGLYAMDTLSFSVESIILSLFALFSFLFVMRKLLFYNLLSEPFFWVNSGILFYFSGNLFIYAFSNYLLAFKQYKESALWSVPLFLNIIFIILISIGFWKTRAR